MSSQQPVQDLSGTVLPVYPVSPCKRCGHSGHFSITCRAKKDTKGKVIETDSEPEYTSDKGY